MIPAFPRVVGATVAVVAATLAGAACGPPLAPPAAMTGTTIGSWPMDEAGGSIMRDQSGSGLDGAIGSAVVVGGGTYRFPGWSQNVDAAGRLAGGVPADAGAVSIGDSRDLLDPGTGSFAVMLRLRSDLTAQGRLPAAPGASYNIVQKARADDPGGFWKLELAGSGSDVGRLRWVLSDGRRTVVVVSAARVDDGQWHAVAAERRGGQSVLTVDGRTAATSAQHVGDIHPNGSYSAAMTVGKKPGSVDPKDAFAGSLDSLTFLG